MSREDLLRVGPEQVSPPEQADGTPSFGIARGHVEKALAGETPVFEWLHKDAEGKLIPSEVRFVRLPSSGGNLIRASIIDITERKQTELVAAGERRALEKIASSEPLAVALSSITEVVERVLPAAICCIRIYDPVKRVLTHVTGKSLPREYVALMDNYPAEIRFGSCAAAIALQRQIIVPDISKDALWEHRREAAARAGLHACWSTPITGRRRAHARHVRDLPAAHRHALAPRPRARRPHGPARAHRDRAAPLRRCACARARAGSAASSTTWSRASTR